ncbi:MAG: cobalamin-binding protein [Chloroflexi bacterium]|nr:cobalamin-binding protein [Chloroflexota bacterium]
MNNLNQKVSNTLRHNQTAIAQNILDSIYKNFSQVKNKKKSLRDIHYHLGYLVEAIETSCPELFSEYIAWVSVLFSKLDFGEKALKITLSSIEEVLQEHFPNEEFVVIKEYLDLARENLTEGIQAPPLFVNPHLPLGGLAKEYLGALLRTDRQAASRMIIEAVEAGTPLKDIYMHVFQSSQYEIGRLWQTNEVSVAQEHYCTAATQLIMSQLYPYLFSMQKNDRRMVATSISGELHEIGMRMVADFFEMDGWDTYYLGANMPSESIIQMIEERNAQLLGISATLTPHIREVENLITKVRKTEFGKKVKILVGGLPFNIAPRLWQEVGADGQGKDANEAISVAKTLVYE